MKKRKNGNAVLVDRLDEKSRLVIGYIYKRLNTIYRNSNGKAVYARNMDQVIKDLFGVKKFTKTLEAGRYNETKMYNLFRCIDMEQMWNLVRSNRNFQLLANLVALDNSICTSTKKLEQCKTLEPAERPTKKMRKLAKRVKSDTKTYKAAIRTLRDMYDIKRYNPNSGSSAAKNVRDFLDNNHYDEDIFGDFSFDADEIESMDDYVRSKLGNKKSKRARHVNEVSLFDSDDDTDIFDDDYDYDDDDDDEDDDELDDRVKNAISSLAARANIPLENVEDYLNGSSNSIAARNYSSRNNGELDAHDRALISAITAGFQGIRDDISSLRDDIEYDDDYEDASDDSEYCGSDINIVGHQRNQMSLNDMMDQADAAKRVKTEETSVDQPSDGNVESTQSDPQPQE